MKFHYLRKKLLASAAVSGAILAACLIISIGLGFFASSSEDDNRTLVSDIGRLRAQATQSEKEYRAALLAQKLYNHIQSFDSNTFYTLDPAKLRPILDSLKQRYNINALSIKISPPEVLKDPVYQSKRFVVQASTVQLDFTGLTDEALLGFAQSVVHEFNGYIHCEKLEINRVQEVNEQALTSIQNGDAASLASGTMQFLWLGLREVSNAEPATGGATPP